MTCIGRRGLFPLVLLLASCVRSADGLTVQLLSSPATSASGTTSGSVELFARGVVPAKGYQELAIIKSGGANEADAIDKMRTRARDLGADGLLLQGWTTPEGRLLGASSGPKDQLTGLAVRLIR